MKKTLTVNLGGTVFHIDEDAYQLLDKYLSNLRIHFRKEEGSEEIMNDFEMRISELFGERVRLGHEVITIEHVEEVINRMGKPEEIFEEETEEEKENAKKRTYQEQVQRGVGRRGQGRLCSCRYPRSGSCACGQRIGSIAALRSCREAAFRRHRMPCDIRAVNRIA